MDVVEEMEMDTTQQHSPLAIRTEISSNRLHSHSYQPVFFLAIITCILCKESVCVCVLCWCW